MAHYVLVGYRGRRPSGEVVFWADSDGDAVVKAAVLKEALGCRRAVLYRARSWVAWVREDRPVRDSRKDVESGVFAAAGKLFYYLLIVD